MNEQYIKEIGNVAFSLGVINKAISTLQNTDKLYFISDYSVQVRFDYDGAILIPKCLTDEFKHKLIAYYTERYNEIVDNLKKIEL